MAKHGVNSVRLPVGYFHVLAGHPNSDMRALMRGTDYEKYAEVYAGAWDHIVKAIQAAQSHGIGVLIDLHGVPGGQNGEGHSGLSNGKAGFWHGMQTGRLHKATIEILVGLASSVAQFDNVVGLELMNEPENDSELQGFYQKAIKAIRTSSDPRAQNLPLYVGDAWNTGHYATWLGDHANAENFLVLDHHLYRCFTPKDHSTPAEQHAQNLDPQQNGRTAQWLAKMSGKCDGSIVIGEWSGALNPGSFKNSQIQSHREGQKLFAQAQWRAFEEYTGGYYFWTLKKEGGPDPGWCMYTAVEKGVLPPSLVPLIAAGRRYPDPRQMAGQVDAALRPRMDGHVNFWSQQKGGPFEHWRFEDGFRQAWTDATSFLAQGGSEIGFTGQLASLRLEAHKKAKGDSPAAWEFKHGYVQAVGAFRQMLQG